jgi:hypothetical protein
MMLRYIPSIPNFLGAVWVQGWGWGQGGEMNQALYAHMNNKRKKKLFILKWCWILSKALLHLLR